jgi:hypothetical protein
MSDIFDQITPDPKEEKKSGDIFDQIPDAPTDTQPSTIGSFGREAVRSIPAGIAGIAGGTAAGGLAGLAGGPLAPVTVPLFALGGGIAAGMATRKLQDSIADEVAPDSFMGTKSAQADAETNPISSFAGSLVGMGKPSASALSGAVKALGTQAGRKGIGTIAKQIGSKEARKALEKATTETIEGTETLTPAAIKAAESQQQALENFGHAVGAGSGVGAMTGMGIAEGEDPGTAALKGVAGLAVKPWVGRGGVFLDPTRGSRGGAKPTETQAVTPEPEPVDPQIESQVDELLASASPATAQAVKETSVKSPIKTGADIENPMRPLVVDEVSSTTTQNEDTQTSQQPGTTADQTGQNEVASSLDSQTIADTAGQSSEVDAETLIEEAPLPDQQIEAETLVGETPATPVAPVTNKANKVRGVGEVNLTDLMPHREVVRGKGSDFSDIGELKESIQKEGINEPLVFTYDPMSGKGLLSDGNHRIVAASELGLQKVPVRLNIARAKYLDRPEYKASQIAEPGTEIKNVQDLQNYLSNISEPSVVEPPVAKTPVTETPTEQIRTPNQFLDNRGGLGRLRLNERLPATDKNPNGLPSLSELLDRAILEQDVETLQWVHNEMQQRMSKPSFQKERMMLQARNAIENLTGQAPVPPELKVSGENGAPRVIKGGPELNPALKAAAERSLAVDQTRIQSAAKPVEPVTSEEPTGTEELENVEPPEDEEVETSEPEIQINATDKAHALAQEKKIDIAEVRPSKGDRITYGDVQKHLNELNKAKIKATPKIKSTPVAEQYAKEMGVDISQVKPNESGAITKQEINDHLEGLSSKQPEGTLVETLNTEPPVDDSNTQWGYANKPSQEYFEQYDQLKADLANAQTAAAKKSIQDKIKKHQQLFTQGQRDKKGNLITPRFDKTKMTSPDVGPDGLPSEKGLADLNDAIFVSLPFTSEQGAHLRAVQLSDGSITWLDTDTTPRHFLDKIETDSPVLKDNISAIAEAAKEANLLGASRNTIAAWAKEGLPTGNVEAALKWIVWKMAQKAADTKAGVAASNSRQNSLDKKVGEGTTTVGDLLTSEGNGGTMNGGSTASMPIPSVSETKADSITRRAVAHMARTDIPLADRIAVGRHLVSEEGSSQFNLSDVQWREISDANQRLIDESSTGKSKPLEDLRDDSIFEKRQTYQDEAEKRINTLRKSDEEITEEQSDELSDWMVENKVITPADRKALNALMERYSGSPEDKIDSLEELLETSRKKLGEERKAQDQIDLKSASTEKLPDGQIYAKADEEANGLINQGYDAEQLMDREHVEGQAGRDPLRAIDAGSQGETQQRGEVIRVTHAEDVLYDLARNPEHDSMVNLVAQHLLDRFAKSGKLLRTPVDIHNRLESGVLGEYDPATGRIALKTDSAAETILEEVLHSLTADRILTPEIRDLFQRIQKEAVKKGLTSESKWKRAADPTILNKNEGDDFHYAFSNPHELLAAALKNREVRDALNNLEVRDSITGKLVNAWEKLRDTFKKALGFNVKEDSALDQYLNKMFDHMSEGGDPVEGGLDNEGLGGVLYQKVNSNIPQNEKISINPSDIRDSYIKRQYGATPKELPERIAQDLVRTSDGSNLQAALDVSQRSLSGLRPNGKTSEASRKAAHAAEAKALEAWAKENGLFISEDEFNRRWEEQGKRGESEHQVYFDEETQTWWKRNTLNFHDGSLTAYLERIAAQRYLFPELAPDFKGFTTFEGELMPVISQPNAVGAEPTELEITNSLKARGFKEVFETGKGMSKAHQLAIDAGLKPPALPEPKRVGFYNEELNLWLEDVHEENAKKLSNGEIGVFDPVTYFVGREPFQRAQGGKLRAISITPQKAKLTRSLEKDLLTADPEVRAMLAGKTYIPESFKQWADVAEDWITNQVQAGDSNRDVARKLLAGGNAGLNSEQEAVTAKYVVAQQAKVLKWALEKQIKSAGVKTIADEVQLAEYTTTGNELTRELSEKATATGKMLSVFRMIAGNMNGRYIIDEYLAPTFKAQAAKLSGDKTARELKTVVQGSIETGAEETVGRARTLIRKIFQSPKDIQDGFAQTVFDFFDAVRDPDNTSPSKNSTPLGIQYAEKAAASLARKIAGSVGKESRVQGPALEILQKNIQTEISARMREVFAGIEAKPDFNREMAVKSLAEGLDISELSERAFDSARESVLANPDAKITPAQRVALEGAKFDGGAMKKAQDILRQEVVFRDVVKKTLSDRTASREALIGEILTNSDLSPEQAVRVADSLRQTYEFEARKAAKTQLDALVKNKEARDAKAGIKQIKESDIQKLLKLVNMGAFTEEKFYNAISDSYKLPTWDEAFAKQIEKEAEDVQALPEGQYRNQRTGDLLNKIATKKTDEVLRGHSKSGRVAKILDITTAAWQAGVLSGPPTQLVNLGGSHLSVLADTTMEGIGYLIKTGDSKYIAEGLSSIYGSILGKRSQQEIGRALKEGTTQYKVNQMEGASNLENLDPTNLPPIMKQLASYAGNLKYVGRVMQALDAMNMVSADEAKQRMATRYFLEQKQGKSSAEVNKIIADLFYPDQTITDGLRATAEKEAASGMYGDSKAEQEKWIKRRMSELLQNNREEIYNGVTEQGTNFAERATYNEQAYGILGKFVAGTASQMNSELKVTKFILSFMNTLSNIMNQSLDYTVWGSVRAMNKSFSQQRFNENSKYAPRKFEEGSPEQAAQFAKSILGTTAFLSLTYMAYKGLLDEQEGKEPFFSIHGAGPQNSMDKQQLIATQNWQPNSVRVGGKWLRYTDWPVLGLALGGLGAIYDAVRYKKDEQTTNELIQAAALSTASTVLQKNMLQGVTTFIDAIGGSKTSSQATAMSRLTSGVVGGYTNPGLFRWARNTFGMDKSGQVARLEQGTTEGWLYSMVPFSMGYNTPALNTLGEPIKQPWYSATTWRFTNASNIPPHPIISPILRAGLMLPNPSKATEFRFLDAQGAIVKGKMGKYPELNRRFVQLRGELMKEMLSPSVIEQLQELSKENKNQAQEYLDSKIGGAARNQAVKMIEGELMDGKLKLG